MVLVVKNLPANAEKRDVGSVPGLGRSPGGGHGNSFQYSYLENPMDRGAWWATVHKVTKSWTWLKQFSMHAHRAWASSVHSLLNISKLNDTTTGTMTVPRSTINTKKWSVAQFLEIPNLFSHATGQNSSWAISIPERWCCKSAALNMPANLENTAVTTGLEKVSFHSNPKERQCQRVCKLSHYCTHLTR